MMLWIFLTVLAIAGGYMMLQRRRAYESTEKEPWRASLPENEQPLDLEEIRRAEDEFLADGEWSEGAEDEEWR